MRSLKKCLTFEFCFTVEMYWKYGLLSLDKPPETITSEKIIPGKLDSVMIKLGSQ